MKNHPVFNFMLFTCFLVIGYTFSLRFYQPGDSILTGSIKIAATESQSAIQTLNNGQRSLLLISTDSLDTLTPQLESVWLVTYMASDTTLQLLPIFPSGKAPLSSFEQALESSFKLNKQAGGLMIDQDFLNVLDKKNYWWSGYIVLDEGSLAKIIDQMGGLDLNGKTISGTQVLSSIPGVADNPQNAYSSQVAILQSLCHRLGEVNLSQDITQLIPLIPSHILTDLDTSQLQMEFDTLYSNQHDPTCRFPTLEVYRIEPSNTK